MNKKVADAELQQIIKKFPDSIYNTLLEKIYFKQIDSSLMTICHPPDSQIIKKEIGEFYDKLKQSPISFCNNWNFLYFLCKKNNILETTFILSRQLESYHIDNQILKNWLENFYKFGIFNKLIM